MSSERVYVLCQDSELAKNVSELLLANSIDCVIVDTGDEKMLGVVSTGPSLADAIHVLNSGGTVGFMGLEEMAIPENIIELKAGDIQNKMDLLTAACSVEEPKDKRPVPRFKGRQGGKKWRG